MQRPPGQVPGLDDGQAAPLVDEVQITVISKRGSRRRLVMLRSAIAAVVAACLAIAWVMLDTSAPPAAHLQPPPTAVLGAPVNVDPREALAEWIEIREGVSARADPDHP